MDTIRLCRRCHAPMPGDPPGSPCSECGSAADSFAYEFGFEGPLTPPSPAELAPIFPGLEIIEVAGAGGMGTIYKARQPQLDRVVALKILSPELGRDPAFANRFSREAQALAKLNHSNIVSVFDFGQAGGHYYFIMEYVDGISLRELINQSTLNAEESQRIIIEICHALQYAHEEGIVHRDIKPSNILLDKKGRVKIADFGLASLRARESREASGGGNAMILMGTPVYMAPEQVDKPWKVDSRADIYSLGVVAYEMLTGVLPVGEIEPPSHRPGVDPRFDQIVMRMLGKKSRRRYQTANEVRDAVESAMGRFHNLSGDAPRSTGARKWQWLPRFVFGAAAIWLLIVTYLYFRQAWQDKTVAIPASAFEAYAANPAGVGISHRMASDLHLSQEQLANANRILRRYQREFTGLERRHTDQTNNAAGHTVVVIQPFPQEMIDLTNRMWANLGTVLTPEQLSIAKSQHLEKFFPHTGQQQTTVEIWQEDDGQYHYVETKESGDKNSRAADLLPPRYRTWFFRDSQQTNK
ncbi:MAG TPA: serine/threonine-protein kinase [Verrucomicrobiae bacterium]|nr:serine/threonine-protein kinase [Verrucomicrobiae bacterium]